MGQWEQVVVSGKYANRCPGVEYLTGQRLKLDSTVFYVAYVQIEFIYSPQSDVLVNNSNT